ncbi:MAG: hypothetical protein IT287_06170 [Bdellovibrionaceae bacterium]|nr:hypothetical protein [Pseudobdellovibrionaceae bacterium]
MKTKSILVAIVSVFILLAGFQNCGKKDNSFVPSETANDFESDQAKLITVVVDDDVTMQIPSLDIQQMFGALPFTCKWAFKNAADEIVDLDGVLIEKLDIDGIQKVEAGRYRVICSIANKSLKAIFIVVVNDKPTPVVEKALLKVDITTETSSKHEEFADITQADALTKCKKYGTDNPTSNVKCLWKDILIFDQVAPVVKRATYSFTSVINGVKNIVALSDVKEVDAKSMCEKSIKELVAKSPNAGYECIWDAKSFKKKNEVIVKGEVKIYLIKMAKESLLLTKKDISKVDAVTLCKLKATENKTVGLKCLWNGDVVYSVPEPVLKDVYQGYFIEKGKERLFITTKDISRADALANCKLNSTNNPKYGIKCTWGKEVIYKKDEPVAKDVYQGYFIEKGKERLFITTKDIPRGMALENCMLNSTNNPKYGIKCTWGKEVIYKKDEPVAKDVYQGYFIEKGKERLFITTKDISRADALANCKLNSTSNPKLGIKCTWGKEVIMSKAQP